MAGRQPVSQFDANGRPILPTSQQVIHGQITNIQNIPGVQPPMSLPPNAMIPNQSGRLRHSVQNPIDISRTTPISIRQSTPSNRAQNQIVPMLIDNATSSAPSRPPTPMPPPHSVPPINQTLSRPHNLVPAMNIRNPPQTARIVSLSMQRSKILEMPKPRLTLKAEYVITPSSVVGKKKLSVMRIRGQRVDLTKLNAPVKLHRRDPEAPTLNGGINSRPNQVIMPGNKPTQVLPSATGTADASLIAPYAGARQNKKNLFKKKTTQVFLADPKSRELKAEESIPWILEDFGGENTFIGDYIGGDSAKYGILLRQGDKLRFVPIHRFYEFQRKLKIRTLTIEEAEEQMARAKKMDNDRWLMRRFGKGKETEDVAENEGGIYDPKSSIKTVEGEDDLMGSDGERRPTREEYDEEMDYDEVFEDDEEDLPDDANPLVDDETKEVGKLKAKVKHPFELNDPTLSDDGNELTTEGKQMKKLIRVLDDNDAYESDRESNPYASESDESDSEGTSSPSSKSPSAAASNAKTTAEKPTDKGKGSASKSKLTSKSTTAKSKVPAGAKIKNPVEKNAKPKATAKPKQTAPKQTPAVKGKGATPANVTSSRIKTPERAIKQVGDVKPKISGKGIGTLHATDKGAVQKQKPIKVEHPVKAEHPVKVEPTTSPPFASTATPNASDRLKSNLGKRTLSNDSTSAESAMSKRVRVDANKKLVKPAIKRPVLDDEGRPGPSESAVGLAKKPKVSAKSSTAGDPQPSSSRVRSLISESEIRNLIITKNVKVADLILSFKNRIKEDSRNKDRLLTITKEIAIYKDGYLVLKSSL